MFKKNKVTKQSKISMHGTNTFWLGDLTCLVTEVYLNLFPNDFQLLQFLEEQMQAEKGNTCQEILFNVMLAKAVAKRNVEVSQDVS